MSESTSKKGLTSIIHAYLKLKTNLTEEQIKKLLVTYENIVKTEGVFEFEDSINNKELRLFKNLGIIREFPRKSGFYIPSSPLEIYQEILKEITNIIGDNSVNFSYVLPLEGIIIKDWKKENLEKFRNVANSLIKNWNDDVIICARRLSPFEPETIAEKLREGRKIKVLLVYPNSKKSLRNVMEEAKQKICDIYKSIIQKGDSTTQAERYIKNLIIKHTNIMGDQFRFMKVGNVTVLVLGSIEKTHYDAIIVENERFSKMIEDVFNTYFEKSSRINLKKLCTTNPTTEPLNEAQDENNREYQRYQEIQEELKNLKKNF